MLSLEHKSISKVSWAPIYQIISYILNTTGLNYFSDTFNDALWKIIVTYGIFIIQIHICFACFADMILPNDNDMEDDISCLIILLTFSNIALKVITIIRHSVILRKLSDTIIKQTSCEVSEPWELKLAEKYHRYAKFICIQVIVLYSLVMVTYIVLPVFLGKDYNMPILMELPGTNRSGHPGYEINYIIGATGVAYGTAIEMGFDIPAFLQICFVAFQLDRCAHYCNMIGDFNTTYKTQEQQSNLLRECIQLHETLCDYIHQVASFIESVIAISIITNVPLLTILLYFILLGTASAAPFLMLTAAAHLFMYCFLGEVVSAKFEEASSAIYASQWYRIEKANDKRMFLFFLTVSQRDMRFKSGGLYKLSLETYTELMKRVYGACAFLNEVL